MLQNDKKAKLFTQGNKQKKILQLFPETRQRRHHGMNHQGIIFRQTVSIGRGPAIFLSETLKKRILYHFPLCWTRICLEALLDRLAPIPTMICATVKQECLMHRLQCSDRLASVLLKNDTEMKGRALLHLLCFTYLHLECTQAGPQTQLTDN